MPSAISEVSYGFTNTPAPSTTSGQEPSVEVTMGAPHAIASNRGIPQPSYSDGNTNASAMLYNTGRSSSSTKPVGTTRSCSEYLSIAAKSGSVLKNKTPEMTR